MATPASTEGGGPPPLYLAGPTASGKSAVALALAERVPAEIISVDSALVYRGMDIGTAKPTSAERAAAPHHLIDIRDPATPYSAAEFVRDAQRLIADIRARGRLPVLVGGTMLYFKALFEGLDDLPPADAAVRRQIEERAAQEGWPALHAELARVDAATAARLAPGDSQRIQRALEVWQLTGQPMSALHTTKSGAARAEGTGTAAKKSAKKAPAKKAAAKTEKTPRAGNLKPSPQLAAVIGDGPFGRGEVMKLLWDYIKANNLQDPKDKRTIVADDKLKPVLGADSVGMFKLAGIVGGHLG